MDASGIVLLVLLGVMVLFMFLGSRRQRQAQEEQAKKVSELKEGDKVRTYLGVYGTIKKFYDSTDGRIVVLELGEDKNKIEFEMEARMLMCLDTKTEVKFDEEPTKMSETEEKQVEIKPEEIEKAKEDIKEKLEEKHADENDGNE